MATLKVIDSEKLDNNLSAIGNAIRSKTGSEALMTIADMPSEILAIEGGAALNFNVIGDVVEPANPAENTIWINTDVAITQWSFVGGLPPWTMPDGWIYFASQVPNSDKAIMFNALKRNEIWINPISAWQCVDGVWIEREAKIYIAGAWVSLAMYLVQNGADVTALTGGWSACYWGHTSTHQRTTPVITWAGDALVMDINQSSMSEWYGDYCYHWGYATNNAIDLTDVKSIEAVVDSSAFGGSYPEDDGGHAWTRLVVGKSRDSSPAAYVNIASRGTVTNKTITLDVSNLTGEYYIGFFASFYCANSKALKVTAYNIELKR